MFPDHMLLEILKTLTWPESPSNTHLPCPVFAQRGGPTALPRSLPHPTLGPGLNVVFSKPHAALSQKRLVRRLLPQI